MNSTRTAGPMVTGEAPFDSPIRRKDHGADLGSISSTWHVARAAPSRLAKKFARTYRSNAGHHRPKTHRSHAYCTNLKSIGGAVPVGCMLHASQAVNVFDVGSSCVRKLRASDTKFGTLVHLANAYFAPYLIRGCGALCACSARANYFHLLPFPAPTGQTVGTADARRAGHMYAATTYVFLWLPFL